jgi:lactoylglutathione lyase
MPTSSEKLSDHLITPGIILFTESFDECVVFYRDKLGLPVWFEKDGLCCLRFGHAYLMIETDGIRKGSRKTVEENPTIIRFNVEDVVSSASLLEAQGISVKISHYDWGTTGAFLDPDGNVCGLKNADDPFFENF